MAGWCRGVTYGEDVLAAESQRLGAVRRLDSCAPTTRVVVRQDLRSGRVFTPIHKSHDSVSAVEKGEIEELTLDVNLTKAWRSKEACGSCARCRHRVEWRSARREHGHAVTRSGSNEMTTPSSRSTPRNSTSAADACPRLRQPSGPSEAADAQPS